MSNRLSFQEVQHRFCAYLRDPQANPVPEDVELRRMQLYSELFYNNIDDFMADSFPVLREITDDQDWQRLIRDYMARHKARTPLFPEVAREFLNYLENEYQPSEEDYPFLLELAHYEWVELALLQADKEEPPHVDPEAELLSGLPVLSSLCRIMSYHYPVQQISSDYLPTEPPEQATHLLAYRDADGDIQYLEMNPIAMRLLQLLQSPDINNCQQALLAIADEIQHPDPELVVQGGLEILNDLKTRGVILGCHKQ